ncbi:hypothetical protein [Methylocapsa aurea]|uniref:hypothetical protein n=1 Tax=Methylocapsa aurea TaxID=663610 RepID=UPI003D18867D
MTDWIEHFRAATLGMTVAHVWRGYGSALLLELGELTPSCRRDGSPAAPRGEIGLMIEWSWRIEDEQSVLCGSLRIPTKPAMHSNMNPATCSDPKPASVPI